MTYCFRQWNASQGRPNSPAQRRRRSLQDGATDCWRWRSIGLTSAAPPNRIFRKDKLRTIHAAPQNASLAEVAIKDHDRGDRRRDTRRRLLRQREFDLRIWGRRRPARGG